jgi:hypothetical protein
MITENGIEFLTLGPHEQALKSGSIGTKRKKALLGFNMITSDVCLKDIIASHV